MNERPVHPREQLDGTGIKPKRNFGQNFLADDTHLRTIARLALALARPGAAHVVEMGAGLGALTAWLLSQGATVDAVERDRDLVPLLRARFGDTPKLTVHEANALTFPFDGLPDGFVVAGNLPYHHAAELAARALNAWPRTGGACFLVQLEVAQRMAAVPGNKDFGSLSVALQARFDVKLAHRVPKGAFWPVPEVDGGVVTMTPLLAPRGAPHEIATLEVLTRRAFGQRRKTLRNALKGLVPDALLASCGIDPGARAEDVPVDAYGRLAAAMQAAATEAADA